LTIDQVIKRCQLGFDDTSNIDEINELLVECVNLFLSDQNLKEKNRTETQSSARWVYLDKMAEEFNERGIDRARLVDEIQSHPKVDAINTKDTMYYDYWLPVHKALYPDKSRLSTKEINHVYDAMNNHSSRTFGVSIPFPEKN